MIFRVHQYRRSSRYSCLISGGGDAGVDDSKLNAETEGSEGVVDMMIQLHEVREKNSYVEVKEMIFYKRR
jgi:hypothetical protein